MQTAPSECRILADIEITTYPCMNYPSVEDFLVGLEEKEPDYGWTKLFLVPLRRSNVHTLEHLELINPMVFHVFYKTPVIPIMDFFAHALETIERIHRTANHSAVLCVGCRGQTMG